MWRRVFRPRTLVYTAVLLAIAVAAGVSLALRNPLKVDVARDRGALAREARPGVVENVYRVQIMNTAETPRTFRITAEGLPGIAVVGVPQPLARRRRRPRRSCRCASRRRPTRRRRARTRSS